MTTTPTPDPKLARVLRIPDESRGRRSPLYLWMKRNFAELSAEFRENGPRWDARVKAMKAAGLVDWNRRPPTVRTAQQTWYRLCRDMEKAPPASAAPSPPRPEVPDQPPVTPTRPEVVSPALLTATPPSPASNPANPYAEVERRTAEAKARRERIEAAKEWNPYATPQGKDAPDE